MLTLRTCTAQGPAETLPEYASRVLRYALRYGPDTLTREQLAHADHCAQLQIAGLPMVMDQDQGRRYVLLVTCRRAIAIDQERRRLSALQDARRLASYAAELDQDETADPSETDQETDQDRAIRLLRAALILVMDRPHPSDGSQDGRGTRLTPPPRFDPTPGGNSSAMDPNAPVRLSGGRF